VTRRVFGAILEWMQNRKKPVFVVATANQVENLPPEFLRKGRFDEIFALDLPTPEEREQIIKVQLKKYKRDPQKFSLQRIIESTNSFSGAEIEGVIVEALYDAFDSGAKELTTEHVVKASESIIPLSKSMAEKIEAIRQWSEGRARSASVQQKREQPSNKRRLTMNEDKSE